MAQNAAHTDLFEVPIREEYYTYRCHYCGQECVKRSGLPSGLPITKIGDYGANATPTPTAYNSLMYSANTISFTAASGTTPAMINDSSYQFANHHFAGDMTIAVVTQGSSPLPSAFQVNAFQGNAFQVSTAGSNINDGTYTIASKGATMGSLYLSTADILTTQSASNAGLVKIYRVLYYVNQHSGCPFCGSLASAGIGVKTQY